MCVKLLATPPYIPAVTGVERYKVYSNETQNSKLYMVNQAPSLTDNEEWNFSDFQEAVKEDMISSVRIGKDQKALKAMTKDGSEGFVKLPNDLGGIQLINDMVDHDVKVRYTSDNNNQMIQWVLGNVVMPLFLFWVMIVLLSRIMNRNGGPGGAGGIFSFSQNQAKFQEIPDTGVTFDDVAGCDNAKRDLQEIVDFLKNPEKYTRLGAKIPKGCLLIGSSGTGKTLLSKAVAGEAKVPFFSCSASEFIELFVGVGASRVRSIFKDAAAKAPCIIFIDEIDAIGKQRSGGNFPGNDERDQTINQLLSEMDGFDGKKGIIVLAATNRPEILDNALTRPGRFDRKIIVERPDCNGRVAILKVHTKDKPLADDVNLESIAKLTAGSSGADLENLANEAAILATRRDAEKIGMQDFDNALEKVAIGDERGTIMSDRQKKLISVHESGHTLVALKVGEYDKVRKVTIIPRGAAGGVTIFEPDQERIDTALYSKEYLENQICVALGGRVAEEVVFGGNQVTTGASSDLIQVMNIARRMVADFGFTEKLGAVAWKAPSMYEEGSGYSQQTAYEIDEEIRKIVNKAYERTTHILKKNKVELMSLADALVEKETMSGDEVKKLLDLK
jgi:cell division protease FtsH